MSDLPVPPPRPRGCSTLPLTVPLALAAAVWVAGLLCGTGQAPPRPQVRFGTVQELAEQIRAAPRAMVYVCSITSTYAVAGRPVFLDAVERFEREHPGRGVQFFVVEYRPIEERAWVESFRDDRLAGGLGYAKYGWVMWLESGCLREADFYVIDHPTPEVEGARTVERTHSLWPR